MQHNHLVIFTRYPEPGKAKTRLIPALGAEGAAALHQHLTEHTLATAQQLQNHYPLTVTICYTGGDQSLMETWLGPSWKYLPQSSGDLGERLISAFQTTFTRGSHATVIIGTDCPELNSEHLQSAFAALANYDLVLGPAVDGGYYLIGLKSLYPQLFQGVTWSTSQVLQQTLSIAAQSGLNHTLLPMLHDIDHPSDLKIWENTVSKQLGVVDFLKEGH